MNLLGKFYDKKISSKGLGVFRIFFSLVLLLEVNRIFRYRQLYFDPIPFFETSPLSAEIPFIIWMLVLMMLIIGAFSRLMALINYIFVVIYISSIGAFEYHMDYTYIGISFLLIFVSISKSYSVDNLRERLNYSNLTHLHKPKEEASVLNYWLLLFVGVGLVYLDSVFFKLTSKNWTSGLGMWYPATLPQITIINNQWLLNQEILIKFLGYLTLFFEILFPFLFWVKRLRIPFLIIGVGLHIGIFIEFPIPYFALGVTGVYALLVPNHFWKTIERKIKIKKPSLTLFYDAECPLCMKTRVVLSFFDIFNAVEFRSVQEGFGSDKRLEGFSMDSLLDSIHAFDSQGNVYEGVAAYKKVFLRIPVFFIVGALMHIPGISHLASSVYNFVAVNRRVERCNADNCGFLPAPQIKRKDEAMLSHNFKLRDFRIMGLVVFLVVVIFLQVIGHFNKPFSNKTANIVHAKICAASCKLLGVTEHGVFMDDHFKGFDKVYTVSYNGKLLPFYTENGMPDYYLRGGSWVYFNFRTNKGGRSINHTKLKRGFDRYVMFWAYKNNISLNNARFKLLKKDIYLPSEWEPNVLSNNLATPWEEIGEMVWTNNKATFVLQE